jgi:hypothetical protein
MSVSVPFFRGLLIFARLVEVSPSFERSNGVWRMIAKSVRE